MVSIIKNQLLKHLSRYTKNLSSDKINISTFKGEGELTNLQLDENVLTELLELPSWLRLTSAWCNHITFKISWAKLKSVPIVLSLDEVNISVETCEIARSGTPTAGGGIQALAGNMGKYSFIHKVIDGITITVNTVNVSFKSPAFTSSVQMSRIRVESRTPKWMAAELRYTRLKDPIHGLILIFKELSWQTVRIEASSTKDKNLTPLRLLTNQAKCRITIKKKLSDCSVLSSRLLLILDDLLWVLTDSQLKAALHFVDSLAGLIQDSNKAIQRKKAQKKLENLPEYQSYLTQSVRPSENPAISASMSQAQKMFSVFDVRETSYHFFSQRIDLHLCDDAGSGRSSHPSLKDGGALQISIQGFQVDYYPYHLAKASRVHWPKYKEASVPPAMWLEQSLNNFKESLLTLSNPNRPPTHAPLERTPMNGSQSGASTPTLTSQMSSPMRKHVLDNFSKLMTSCVIVRVEDFTLYRVTTSGKKQMPKEFISGDKERFSFPPEMPTLHAEFTYFYYPGDFVFPLPPSKCFVYVNPVQLNFDVDSCLWFASFGLGLHESLMKTSVADNINSPTTTAEPSMMYMDVKMEAIMPRVIFESTRDVSAMQRDRPKIMQVQVSRFAVTNIREMGASRADLAQAIHSLQEGTLVFSSGFPSKPDDLCIVTDKILSHIAATDVSTSSTLPNSPSPSLNQLSRYALWNDSRDVWCVKIDPVWIDFLGARSIGANRSIPFIDAVPITLWIHGKSQIDDNIVEKMAERVKPPKAPPETPKKNEMILSVMQLAQEIPAKGSFAFDNIDSVKFSKYNDTNGNVHSESFEATSQSMDEKSADLHIIAHFGNLVSIQLDHYQLLFLLRLAEEVNELTTFLTMDNKRIMQEKNPNQSVIFGCVIPQVEVTLVMPSQTPGKESSGGDGESVLPDSASLGDDLHTTNSGWQQGSFSLDGQRINPFSSIESPSPTNTKHDKFDYPVEAKSNIKFNIPSDNEAMPPPATAAPNTGNSSSSSSTSTLKNKSRTDNSLIPKELNTSLSHMKKGFSNFMTSIDSALKTNASFDDASDSISIQSDFSDDSEFFTVLADTDKATTDCNDFMFKLNPFSTDGNKLAPVEVASEMCEDPFLTNLSSPSEPSEASSLRRRDLVSMATFRLTTVELIRHNVGSSSVARIQVAAVSLEECESIPWDEFQNDQLKKQKTKFGVRCRAWNVVPHDSETTACVAIRFEEELNLPEDLTTIVDKKSVANFFDRQLNVKVKDFRLPSIQMSTVIGLADLAEDEVITPPFPMNVELENIKINIIEDRPPVNITSPGPQPMNVVIGRMKVVRDVAGIFQIQPIEEVVEKTCANEDLARQKKERDREVLSMQLVMQQLKVDNDHLRRQATSAEKNMEVNRQRVKQENEMLKSYLKASQDDVASLLDEKRTLMDTIKSLQSQLICLEPRDGKR